MYSLEMISGFVPKQHKRLIAHIRKTNERQKRKKREKREEKMSSAREDWEDCTSSASDNKSSKPR